MPPKIKRPKKPSIPKPKDPLDDLPVEEKTEVDVDEVITPYGKRTKSTKKRPVVQFLEDDDSDKGDSSDEAGEADEVDEVNDYQDWIVPDKYIRKFVNEVAPAIGLSFVFQKTGSDPLVPSMTWKLDNGDELPAYLVVVDKPVEMSDVPQYSFALPMDFFERHNTDSADFHVFVYIRFAKKYGDVDLLTGVWSVHIQDLFDLIDGGGQRIDDIVAFDARMFECYSVNTLGNPVRLIIE